MLFVSEQRQHFVLESAPFAPSRVCKEETVAAHNPALHADGPADNSQHGGHSAPSCLAGGGPGGHPKGYAASGGSSPAAVQGLGWQLRISPSLTVSWMPDQNSNNSPL